MKKFTLEVTKNGYPVYCTDEQAFYVAIGMHKLDLSLKSQTPVWVVTNAKDHGVKSTWHLYLAMHVTDDPQLQQLILEQPTAEQAEKVLLKNKDKIRADIKEVRPELQKWVMCLHLAMKYKEMQTEFKRFANKDVVYLCNPNNKGNVSQYGCQLDPIYVYGTDIKFWGSNQYGRSVKRLIEAFNENPKKFLTVSPPDIENCKFLGSPIRQYKRLLTHEDSQAQPTTKQVIKQKPFSKSKYDVYMES